MSAPLSLGPLMNREPVQKLFDRGFRLVFYPSKQKGPIGDDAKGWTTREYRIVDYIDGQNVGVMLGTEFQPGRFLGDVDFDWPDGLPLTKGILPKTYFGFGRKSRPVSHAFFSTSSPVRSRKFTDINKDGQTFVEFRGTKADGTIGLQTMVPPSIHPSGEPLVLRSDGDITHDDSVPRRVALYATACILLKHLGHRGLLHDARLSLVGFLLQCGATADEVLVVGEALAAVTGNNIKDIAECLATTAPRVARGERVKGAGELAGIIGDDGRKVIARIREWVGVSQFIVDEKGRAIANSAENVRRALVMLDVKLSYNEFARRPEVEWRSHRGRLDDAVLDDIWMEVDSAHHFSPKIELFSRTLLHTARQNATHPVRSYLDGLQWDGVARIDGWLTTYAKAKDTTLTRAIASIVLIAAVRRVRQPGCKFDELLILESAQGTDKSSALRALCPDESWFSDDLPLNLDAKQIIERTAGKWLVEAAELHGLGRRELDYLKASLSRQVDGPVRLAYGHLSEEVPRQFVTIGTTNHHQFLKDKTGNRRFWPVRVSRLDVASLRRDRDQLWAEAAHREAAGESIRLEPSLYADAAKEQAERVVHDPWLEKVRDGLSNAESDRPDYMPKMPPQDRLRPEQVWQILGMSIDRRDERSAERISGIMQALGYEWKRAKGPASDDAEKKVTRWRWCLVDGQPEQATFEDVPQ